MADLSKSFTKAECETYAEWICSLVDTAARLRFDYVERFGTEPTHIIFPWSGELEVTELCGMTVLRSHSLDEPIVAEGGDQ